MSVAEAKEAKAHADEATGFATNVYKNLSDLLGTRVAGPCYMQFIYYFTILASLIFFVYTLAILGSKTWTKELVIVEDTFTRTFPMPDVYTCIFAGDVARFYANDTAQPGLISIPDKANCVGGVQYKLDLTTKCIGEVTISQNHKANVSVTNNPKDTFLKVDPYALTMANKLGLDKNKNPSMCFRFNPKKAIFDSKLIGPTMYGFEMGMTQKMLTAPPTVLVFLLPGGVDPKTIKNDKLSVLLTKMGGTTAMINVRRTQMKDETKGESAFTTKYEFNIDTVQNTVAKGLPAVASTTWSIDNGLLDTSGTCTAPNCVSKVAGNTGYAKLQSDTIQWNIALTPSSYFLKKVVLRYPTPGEIWSAVGGAYAGALLMVAVLFERTTKVDKAGTSITIFKYLPSTWRTEWLEPFQEPVSEIEKLRTGYEKLRAFTGMENDEGIDDSAGDTVGVEVDMKNTDGTPLAKPDSTVM